MNRLLMVAYHFPPVSGSSGLQRTLSFARYLPQYDWEPLVLSAHPRSYEQVSSAQLADLPPDLVVKRAFALDTARHLSLGGRYLQQLALPDRWVSWCLGALPLGLWMIRRHRPAAIWSTYPIATAHLIGVMLARLSGLPLIADFRDSMTEEGYPREPSVRRAYIAIERAVVARARRCVFTAPGALEMYAERYPDLPRSRLCVIENGYDEGIFDDVQGAPPGDGPAVLLHAGVIYPAERDPSHLFDAVAMLRREEGVGPDALLLRLRASGSESRYREMLEERGIEDMVSLEPPVPYRDALTEMMSVHGLLVLQARNCNHQIPAKAYEYLRSHRPIIGLADAGGDTARMLRDAGIDTLADLDDAPAIARVLREFLSRHRQNRLRGADPQSVEAAGRSRRTGELAALLDSLLRGD